MRYILIGNYGVGNLGDELLREYFLNRFSDIEWTTVSAAPGAQEVPRLPLGFRSFFHPWWRTLWAYWTCDGVVFGGGSLFTDTESAFACVLWWWHAFVAWIFGKPFFLAFQGIGPLRTCIGFACTRWVVYRTAFCSVRDEASAKRLEAWGVKVVRSVDPVVGLVGSGKDSGETKNRLIIIPRQNSGCDFFDRVREVFQNSAWDAVVILSLQPDHPGEKEVCERLQQNIKKVTLIHIRTLKGLVEEIHQASLVLSQRYHGALVALVLGKKIEIIHQAEGDKLTSLQENLSKGISALRTSEETLRSALMRATSPL